MMISLTAYLEAAERSGKCKATKDDVMTIREFFKEHWKDKPIPTEGKT